MVQIFAFFWENDFHDRQFSQTQSQLLYCIQVRFVIIVGYDLNLNENQNYTMFSILIYGVFLSLGPVKDQICPGMNTSAAEQVLMQSHAHWI